MPCDTGSKATFLPTEPAVPLFYAANQDPQGDLKKHSIFKPVPKAAKSAKLYPGPLKNTKNLVSNHRNTFSANRFFLQYFNGENLVSRAPTVNISTQKNIAKSNLKTNPKTT